jgi:hypothetical protein
LSKVDAAAFLPGSEWRCAIFKAMIGRAHVGRMCLLITVLVSLVAGTAYAQDGFRITYDVDRSRAERARLTGRVVNERNEDVFEVNITAEALDGRGKVLARGITYVDARIARGDGRQFSVSVPTVAGTANFRVAVSSFRAGFSNQGP